MTVSQHCWTDNGYRSAGDSATGTPWEAIARYGVRPAPGGLAMVHDFLNTQGSQEKGSDLLGDATRATQWTRTVIRAWARPNNRHYPLQPLTNHDAERLRQLRDDLLTSLTGMPVEIRTVGAATFTLAATGEICWAPSGAGWRWVYGAILGEVLLSQHTGSWRRLKHCQNGACLAIFYDSSWNNSAVWHNAGTCGTTNRQSNSGDISVRQAGQALRPR